MSKIENEIEIGIVEGFFGPQWSNQARIDYVKLFQKYGGDFYIYAPKQDAFLRKRWREEWPSDYLQNLKDLVNRFQSAGIKFGIALSPFNLDKNLNDVDVALLEKKASLLDELGVDILGLFFDDMKSYEGLADNQIRVVEVIKRKFSRKIIFCPSYYTPDPILDKVFGQRPDHYLEDVSTLPSDICVAWTGPKVISPTIDLKHLEEVSQVLKRPPFIWENLFANDGPRNYKFLKLRSFDGREEGVLSITSGWAFNLMNQPYLSQIAFVSSLYTLRLKQEPDKAFSNAVQELCSPLLAEFILANRKIFLEQGLDKIDKELKQKYINFLTSCSEKIATDILDWLEEKYFVDNDCLTD